MLLSLICAALYNVDYVPYYNQQKIEPSIPIVFYVKNRMRESRSFMIFFNLDSNDIVRFKYGSVVENEDCSQWELATEEQKKQLWISKSNLAIFVQTRTTRYIRFRGGMTIPRYCPSGTILQTKNNFNIQDYADSYGKPGSAFCVIFLQQKISARVTNTLLESDKLSYLVKDKKYMTIGHRKTIRLDDTNIPLYLFFNISQDTRQRNFVVNVNDRAGTLPNDIFVIDKDVPSKAPDETGDVEETDSEDLDNHEETATEEEPEVSTPTETTSETTTMTVESSDSPSEPPVETTTVATSEPPSETSQEPTQDPPVESSERKPTSEPIIPSEDPIYPDQTPISTPDATWEGDWDDPPNVIIRGDDIPMIHETHPPVQTEYIKTEVPKVVKFVNVSCGTGIIIAIVALTLFNILRTARRIKLQGAEFASNDSFDDLSSSFLVSDEYSSGQPNV